MQYRNLVVGQQVLFSEKRTSSPRFRLGSAVLAEVTGLGVSHSYYAQGGYAGGGGHRETALGVLVRIGDKERVTLAAHLLPASGKTFEDWKAITARLTGCSRDGCATSARPDRRPSASWECDSAHTPAEPSGIDKVSTGMT